jgi:hypothetical protein
MSFRKTLVSTTISFFFLAVFSGIAQGGAPRPNVILIITDDQGFGDIGRAGELDCHDASADPLIASTPSTATQQRPISCSSPRTVLVAGENST